MALQGWQCFQPLSTPLSRSKLFTFHTEKQKKLIQVPVVVDDVYHTLEDDAESAAAYLAAERAQASAIRRHAKHELGIEENAAQFADVGPSMMNIVCVLQDPRFRKKSRTV